MTIILVQYYYIINKRYTWDNAELDSKSHYLLSTLWVYITKANNNIVISTYEHALSGFLKCCKICSYYIILYVFAHPVRIIFKCVYSTKLIKWWKEAFSFVASSTISNTSFYVWIIPLMYTYYVYSSSLLYTYLLLI